MAHRLQGRERRVLTEPGKLESLPEGQSSIFARIRLFLDQEFMASTGLARIAEKFGSDHPAVAMYSDGLPVLQDLADRYNAGERWVAAEPPRPVPHEGDSAAVRSAKARFLSEQEDKSTPKPRFRP